MRFSKIIDLVLFFFYFYTKQTKQQWWLTMAIKMEIQGHFEKSMWVTKTQNSNYLQVALVSSVLSSSFWSSSFFCISFLVHYFRKSSVSLFFRAWLDEAWLRMVEPVVLVPAENCSILDERDLLHSLRYIHTLALGFIGYMLQCVSFSQHCAWQETQPCIPMPVLGRSC